MPPILGLFAVDEPSLFAAALERPAGPARTAFVNQACANNPALRQRLENLLAAHDRTGLLDRLADPHDPARDNGAESAPAAGHSSLAAGDLLAERYRLLERIGEGGMGEVFVAEQTEPVRRKVAVKVIRADLDRRSVLDRFDHERQALAVMDHPNIAKVFDGGATEMGRPYFVMEYIKGTPITEYCDRVRMPIRKRLELMASACHAVPHAHQKGVIHRDLKPSNILVALYDGRPVVKVIDFGLAKTFDQPPMPRGVLTGHGIVLGTPLYMSPEQATLNNLDIDTRSDVYSLGVVLYELLTGSTPIEPKRFQEAAWDEALRLVREEDPPSPSTRLSSTAELPGLAALRQLEPARLSRAVARDLDWVVMKALDKDRARRYDTASALAADLERFLRDEAVQASPPSASYRFRKFARRNQGALVAAGMIAGALVLGTAVSIWQAVQATHAKRLAIANAAKAEHESETTKAISDFLQQDLLGMWNADAQFDAGIEPDPNLKLATLLERAVAKVDKRFADKPAVRYEVRSILSTAFQSVGRWQQAQTLLEQNLDWNQANLGPDHSDTLYTASALADLYAQSGQVAKAIALLEPTWAAIDKPDRMQDENSLYAFSHLLVAYLETEQPSLAATRGERALELSQQTLGPNHSISISIMTHLGHSQVKSGEIDRGVDTLEQAVTLAKLHLGDHHPATARALLALGRGYLGAGRPKEAQSHIAAAIDAFGQQLGPDHPHTLAAASELSLTYLYLGELEKAYQVASKALDRVQSLVGPDHPAAISLLATVGRLEGELNRPQEALIAAKQVLDRSQRVLGELDPSTLKAWDSLASAHAFTNQLEQAIEVGRKALALKIEVFGPRHRSTALTMSDLASSLADAAQYDEAIRMYEQALELRTELLGPDHSETIRTLGFLAFAQLQAGHQDQALPLFENAVTRFRANQLLDTRDGFAALKNLASLHWRLGQLDKSIPLFEEVFKLESQSKSAGDLSLVMAMANLGVNYRDAGRFDKAIPMLQAAQAQVAGRQELAWVADALLEAYARAGMREEAEPLLRELAERAKTKVGPNTPEYAGCLAILADNLLAQDKFAEAELVLRECLAIREQAAPDAWTTYNTRSMLGAALLGQKNYAEAEPLLVAGGRGVLERRAAIMPPELARQRVTEALERLVQLYETLAKPDEAARWRDELKTAQDNLTSSQAASPVPAK